jgi:heme A synthase
MKLVGIIGTLIFLGIIIQIPLGYIVATNRNYLPIHIGIGILGLILIGYELFYALKSNKQSVKILNSLALLLVLIQIGIGSNMIENDSETLSIAHQANAYILLIIIGVIGYLTFSTARKEKTISS